MWKTSLPSITFHYSQGKQAHIKGKIGIYQNVDKPKLFLKRKQEYEEIS